MDDGATGLLMGECMTWLHNTYTALSAHHLQAVGLAIHNVAQLDKGESFKTTFSAGTAYVNQGL